MSSLACNFATQLPIRCTDFDNSEQKKMHDDLVVRLLELNRRLKGVVEGEG